MKRRTLLASMVAFAVATGVSHAEEKKLVVGVDVANKPFVFTQDNNYTGFSYDVWVEVAKEMGTAYELRAMDFSSLIPALQTGNIDAAFSSIFITPKRQLVVDFSDPYYQNGTGMLVPDTSPAKVIKDLDGKKIASITGSAQVGWIKDNLPNAEQVQFPALTDALFALQAGRADAMLYDYPTLAYYYATEGKGKVRLLGEHAGSDNPVGFAFPKGSEFVGRVNEALKKIRSDGRYDALVRKWFGKSAS